MVQKVILKVNGWNFNYTLFRIISGATYSGVPQKVHVLRPESMCFENPKSTILM